MTEGMPNRTGKYNNAYTDQRSGAWTKRRTRQRSPSFAEKTPERIQAGTRLVVAARD